MSEIKLLPCPFCGGNAEISSYETESLWSSEQVTYTKASCPECEIAFQTEPGHEPQSIAAWNRRAYLSSAAVAEREPVAQLYDWTDDDGETQTDASTQSVKSVNFQPVRNVRPLYLDPPPVSELEAENARLRDRVAKLDKAVFDIQIMSVASAACFTNAQLENILTMIERAARRVREGGR